jgi:hypothetical protein
LNRPWVVIVVDHLLPGFGQMYQVRSATGLIKDQGA